MIKKLMRWLLITPSVIILMTPIGVNAHVTPDRTRIIYKAGDKFETLPMINTDSAATFAAEAWTTDMSSKSINQDFFISPRFFLMSPQQHREVKVIMLPTVQKQLPQDRESMFLIHTSEAPPKDKDINNKLSAKKVAGKLSILVNYVIKLIYRPQQLKTPDASFYSHKVTLSCKDKDTIQLNNPTGYFINIAGFSTDDLSYNQIHAQPKRFDKKFILAKPFSKATLTLTKDEHKALQTSHKITFFFIDDFGGIRGIHFALSDADLSC
ncbi:fimbrial biogenesis chaperone [Cysteiniphilum sp. 6C5]|uniref:fimbrial biogenesis chaperone n=1 Tax=unclassified Cysteiniphilum TaxID=2610889 RepID=UPI003F84543D